MKTHLLLAGLIVLGLAQVSAVGSGANTSLIDLGNRADIAKRRPILIAHRGGVVTPQSGECSLEAIQLAGAQGYDMVELDIRRSRDGIPVVFHDRNLQKACGHPETTSQLTVKELSQITYLTGGSQILTLKQAVAECKRQNLGIMLDLKEGRNNIPFLKLIDQLIADAGFENATNTFSGSPEARATLKHVRFTITDTELKSLKAGNEIRLKDRFWFGLPQHLQDSDIKLLQKAGALIFPAINTFRYPAENHQALAKKDIDHLLEQGVHGFQLDSVYYPLIPRSALP